MNGKILTSLLLVGLMIVLVGGATFANFYDTETSAGNTFTASTLDLTVNSKDDPLVWSFNETTLTPGECIVVPIVYTLRNKGTVDGYIDIQNVTIENTGGRHPEPEHAVDPDNNGSLGENLHITITMMGSGGAADIYSYSGNLNAFAGDHDSNVTLTAGDSTHFIITWEVSDAAGNEIQGDIANVSITFELAQTPEQ